METRFERKNWAQQNETEHTILGERYRLNELVFRGASSELWRGTDLLLERPVAIKRLLPDDAANSELERFRNEAQLQASFAHPRIVSVFDADTASKSPYMVMEWIAGGPVKREIRARQRLDVVRSLEITIDVLDALGHAHAAGIIHRDIKPHNVLRDDQGSVKLGDFGIACSYEGADQTSEATTAGSAAYMAPEQAQGRVGTPATDIYSVGVMLYEMLTGRLPFEGDDPVAVMKRHVRERVPRPRRYNPGIPPELESIVLTALSKNPEDRFQNAATMRSEIRSLVVSILHRRSGQTSVRAYQPAERSPRYAWIAGSFALMLVMILGATALATRDLGSGDESSVDPDSVNPATTEVDDSNESADPGPSELAIDQPEEPPVETARPETPDDYAPEDDEDEETDSVSTTSFADNDGSNDDASERDDADGDVETVAADQESDDQRDDEHQDEAQDSNGDGNGNENPPEHSNAGGNGNQPEHSNAGGNGNGNGNGPPS